MTKEPSLKKRLFLYPLVALVFLVISIIIVYSAMGYQISFKDGKIKAIKTGLIILNTKPGDAKVFVDGKLYKKRTPAFSLFTIKINKVFVGEHKVKIQKDGYEDWEGVFNVEPGLVSWGNYIILLPKERKAESYDFAGEVIQSISSKDKTKEMVVVENKKGGFISFWEINTVSKEKRRVHEFYYKPDESYRLFSYSLDNQRLLFEKKVGQQASLVTLDVTKEGGTQTNITSLFNINMDKVVFNPRNHNELYGLRAGNLYSLNYNEKRMSAILESAVSDFYAENEGLLFVQKSEDNYGLWRLDANGKTNMVKTLPASDKYQIAHLDQPQSYAVLSKKDKELYIHRNIQGKSTLKRIGENVDYFIVSPEAGMLAFSKDGSIYTYDVEREKCYTAIKDKPVKWISWFYDDENLAYGDETGVRIVNYNGFYDKEVFKSENRIKGFSAPNSLNLYFSNKDESGNTEIFFFGFKG